MYFISNTFSSSPYFLFIEQIYIPLTLELYTINLVLDFFFFFTFANFLVLWKLFLPLVFIFYFYLFILHFLHCYISMCDCTCWSEASPREIWLPCPWPFLIILLPNNYLVPILWNYRSEQLYCTTTLAKPTLGTMIDSGK